MLAFSGDDPAGLCAGSIRTQYNEKNGTREGMVEALGVRRAYRKRGLGRALLMRTVRLLAGQGMTSAVLDVDADSPTGATRLYESVGFAERKRSVIMHKTLATLGSDRSHQQ